MELLLNLAWLLVTIVSSIVLLRCARMQPNSAQLWLMVTAVVCIMILLFPVISMTDDLHAESFTAEESGKRRVMAIQLEHQLISLQSSAVRLGIADFIQPNPPSSAMHETSVPRPLDGIKPDRFTRPPPLLALT